MSSEVNILRGMQYCPSNVLNWPIHSELTNCYRFKFVYGNVWWETFETSNVAYVCKWINIKSEVWLPSYSTLFHFSTLSFTFLLSAFTCFYFSSEKNGGLTHMDHQKKTEWESQVWLPSYSTFFHVSGLFFSPNFVVSFVSTLSTIWNNVKHRIIHHSLLLLVFIVSTLHTMYRSVQYIA